MKKSKGRRIVCLFCLSLLAMSSKPNDGYNTDFGPDAVYIDDYDVSGKSSAETGKKKLIPFNSNCFDRRLGKITSRTKDAVLDYTSKMIYKSGWVPSEPPTMKDYLDHEYYTYEFARFVDFSVFDLLPAEAVPAHQTVNYNLKISKTYSETYSQESASALRSFVEFSASQNMSIGAGMNLDEVVNANATAGSSFKIQTGEELYRSISSTRSTTNSLNVTYDRTVTYDNSNSNVQTKFLPCIRQKFKVYFTICLQAIYETEETHSGTFNLDTHWNYERTGTKGIKTTFFLYPVDKPYFEISKYVYSSDGYDTNLNGVSNNILFL